MSMKILITGGAGFIGGHTADALIAEGHQVRILDNLCEPVHRNGKPFYLARGAELIIGDVRIKSDWERALDGIDAVYHFAAYQDYLSDFSTFFYVNSVGTALLFEVAVEKKISLDKIIVASSQAVYGEGCYADKNGVKYYPNIRSRAQLELGEWEVRLGDINISPIWTDEEVVNPQNQYAVSKYTQELISLNLGKRYDMPVVCMRYSIVQGPRQSLYNAYSGACRIFSLSCLYGRQPTVYEDGLQIRDFVNIEDVVAANLLVLKDSRANFEVYGVGSGKPYTVKEFANLACRVYGMEPNPTIQGDFRFGDTRHIMSDNSKLRSLGWMPNRDVIYSLRSYKDWLNTQTSNPEILDMAEKSMRHSNVLGSVNKIS